MGGTEDRILIAILGGARSGKTYTWNHLFGHEVRTGRRLRRVYLDGLHYTEAFLVSRSPGKRKVQIEEILKGNMPNVVLCSLNYQKNVVKTLDYFIRNHYTIYLQWLNPGFSDDHDRPLFYDLGLITRILTTTAYVSIRNGKEEPDQRVEEIRDFLYGWTARRGLLREKGKVHPRVSPV
ncbi:MAG TPA: hypothetical protein PLE85_05050 [Bacteroidales bacterium]|nr:hypothetical protein [Lentimicrobiaceae bacterium]HOH99889.1 hypothetical protein [Bacteroidales bacterium]